MGFVEDECYFNTLWFLKSKLRKQIDNPLGLGVPNIILVQFIALETKKMWKATWNEVCKTCGCYVDNAKSCHPMHACVIAFL